MNERIRCGVINTARFFIHHSYFKKRMLLFLNVVYRTLDTGQRLFLA